MRKILKSYGLFLTTSLVLILAGCATPQPVVTKFDAEWTFEPGLPIPGKETKACLFEQDTKKLKELLDRCKAAQ
jgi:hypothetical protein